MDIYGEIAFASMGENVDDYRAAADRARKRVRLVLLRIKNLRLERARAAKEAQMGLMHSHLSAACIPKYDAQISALVDSL